MKMLKKLFAFVAAFAMLLALPTTVLAEGDESATTSTYSVTINNASGTYRIYQVFKGDLSVETDSEGKVISKTLSNVEWGKDVNSFSYTTKEATETGSSATTSDDASEIAEYLATKSNDSTVAKDFAEKAINAIKKVENEDSYSGEATADEKQQAIFTELKPGYYVIKNTSVAEDKTYTRYILQVVGNAEVDNKASVPSFDKKVQDTNDSTGKTSDWQDSADYDIGDNVPFKLTGTVASTYDSYKQYYFAFHDEEEYGLTFNPASVNVYLDANGNGRCDENEYVFSKNKDYVLTYTQKTTDPKSSDKFDIVFSNLKNITSVTGGSKIVVEYNSTLNEDAVIGNKGNVNKAKLEFSNNPNEVQSGDTKPGTGETPWDNVVVFTYETVINKVNENNQPLSGAEFTLKKVKVDAQGNATTEEVKTYTFEKKDEKGNEITNPTTFTFKGLDEGTYVLSETKTPSGYNSIDDITFTVNANHTITWDGTKTNNIPTDKDGNYILSSLSVTSSDAEFYSDAQSGKLTSAIVNKKGTILPSTGGIGTTVFYVTGAILMLGAGVLLVSRKRVSK